MRTINEYKIFDENLSAYIDNELDLVLALKIKKFLIKSRYAKTSFAHTNNLINLMKKEFNGYSDRITFKERLRGMQFFWRKIFQRVDNELCLGYSNRRKGMESEPPSSRGLGQHPFTV